MKIVVLSGYGLNCEKETAFAFVECGRKLGVNNIEVRIVHINEIIKNPGELRLSNILAIPGGFSYGDDTGAGNAFALRVKNNLLDKFQEFLSQDKLVIGICNGCQILAKLIPEFSNLALIRNDIGNYQCRWIKVKVSPQSSSVWLQDLNELYLPIAHGEGKFFMNQGVLDQLIENNSVALRYINESGDYANLQFPYNPNGSTYDLAALSDKSGRVLALMPHPERGIFFTQQDNWPLEKEKCKRLKIAMPKYGDGMLIFENALRYFC
ncbi:phosphoribosylformylglycinamidine synthase subunit PurQ [Wolbachia endosymbiont of Brugia malayi]|uniref:phosphoribosylformylglycinamidine synthase subunit PurQ n=1 Tax=Wolbachia endosymbiont of Brugia malayi TaxID=80849 RepID=UPI00004C92F8|nr:phosphoribosylformylglycinamidine synthase subunit PurQ [Wolbachia endosymbiont of Brugia malayi]AAW70823.1 Phosphoribosylformylglycinamidine (FGAM) synthase, glutamine amidotransferase domain [Wolbachia endosymbiont strain TRS of Brugia malayi]QCB61789.1 phosphoribosylformylglycinamidine synthase subunit PurQ [Wolbachia endosymbiont of Brugia malayi]